MDVHPKIFSGKGKQTVQNNYKTRFSRANGIQKFSQKVADETDDKGEILNQISEIVNILVQSIHENKTDMILNYLNQIYEYKEYFIYTSYIFNEEIFYLIFIKCIEIDSQEIIKSALKILNNLLATNVSEFSEYMFSSDLPQEIVNFFSSPNVSIKSKSLSTICILSQFDPEQSLEFWNHMISSLSSEVADIILSYIYNVITYLQHIYDYSTDKLIEILQIIKFSVHESNNKQAKFDALKVISKGLNLEFCQDLFIEEYSNDLWLSFFVDMIHLKGKSNHSIEYGYLILKELVPFLDDNQTKKILDTKLIAKHLDYDNDFDGNFIQKYSIPIVKECFNFLYELFDNWPLLISIIIKDYFNGEDDDTEDIMIKIFMIILYSVFEIREVASHLLCLIINNSSRNQITSLSLNYLIDSLFCILDFDPQQGKIVIDCLSKVINSFIKNGLDSDEIVILFESNNASEVFDNLIDDDDAELNNQIDSICNCIGFIIQSDEN